jgi:hypothetical protein
LKCQSGNSDEKCEEMKKKTLKRSGKNDEVRSFVLYVRTEYMQPAGGGNKTKQQATITSKTQDSIFFCHNKLKSSQTCHHQEIKDG